MTRAADVAARGTFGADARRRSVAADRVPVHVRRPPGSSTLISELEEAGHGVVLAHPERSPAFQRDPQMLESLVRGGVLTSITAGSLVGRFGAAGQSASR